MTTKQRDRERTRGMNTALHRRTIVLWVLGLVAALVLAGAGAASAQTPITKTQVEPYKDVWVDLGPCRDEPYEWTVTDRSVWHVTAAGIDENGDYIPPFRIHSSEGLGR